MLFQTPNGVSYFKEAEVRLIQRPLSVLENARDFLASYGFENYLNDIKLTGGLETIKFAGQLCYLSLGDERTKNKDASKYIDNIKASGHGSVLEHANFTFLIWGCSRSFTHELVRHRHAGYSQLSQRYVDGKFVRFVERPEYQGDSILHNEFESWIEKCMDIYERTAKRLLEIGNFENIGKRDARKKVNQAARSHLPNETEAPIVVSMNPRAIHHVLTMRVTGPAEVEIRRVIMKLFLLLREAEPILVQDFEIIGDCLETKYKKV